jgi:hypothetical protein
MRPDESLLLVLTRILRVLELHRGGLFTFVIFLDAFIHDLGIGVIALWIFFQHRVVLLLSLPAKIKERVSGKRTFFI